MKMILATLVLVSSAMAAQEYTLPQGATSLVPVAGQVTSVEPLCPQGMTCFVDGTSVNLSIPLGGCLDTLAPLTYEATVNGNFIDLYVSAIRVTNRRSMVAFCTAEPIAHETIQLPNLFGQVRVHFLGAR